MSELIDAVVVGAGQAGLTDARTLREAGLEPVILEAWERPTGSWGRYYDSLTLFSPARYSGLPSIAFPWPTPIATRSGTRSPRTWSSTPPTWT